MYPNLLGQKEYYRLTDREMAAIIGVSRSTYCRKLSTGSFYPGECQAYCRYFGKPFRYLFATERELCRFLGDPFAASFSAAGSTYAAIHT